MKRVLQLFNKTEGYLFMISWFVKISIIIILATAIFRFRILTAGLALLALAISFLPMIIRKTWKIVLPPEFEILFVLFLYATLVLGEYHGYYTRFHWWDILLHSFSAFMFGIIGFMIVYTLSFTQKVDFTAPFAALFSFSFAMMIGGMWEIFEFGMDQALGLNMQKSGLIDTMWDLIVDALGALLVSIIGYFYMKGGDSLIMQRIVTKFVRINEKRFSE